jgi:hypothetical protein
MLPEFDELGIDDDTWVFARFGVDETWEKLFDRSYNIIKHHIEH